MRVGERIIVYCNVHFDASNSCVYLRFIRSFSGQEDKVLLQLVHNLYYFTEAQLSMKLRVIHSSMHVLVDYSNNQLLV